MPPQRVTTLPSPPRRPADSHKGSFGRVLLVAGSRGMTGAAVLSGLGALRGGAGLVSVACPASVQDVVAGSEPSYLTIGLPLNDAGALGDVAYDEFAAAAQGKNAIGIGPGLGTAAATARFIARACREVSVPMVIDADGLNALAATRTNLSDAAGPRILTPHPGEFARLTGSDIASVQSRREDMSVEFAARHKLVLVLKGAGTVVTDGDRLYTNTTGNSGMATGGTGDVLTGLIAALLAQNMKPFEAAQLGVFLHGRAGDLAATELSQPGLIASDLPRSLGAAWKSL